MQKILITDTNILIRLAAMFMDDAEFDIANLSGYLLYVPQVVCDECLGLKKDQYLNNLVGPELRWILDTVQVYSILKEPTKDELDEEYEYYQSVYELLAARSPDQFSDPPSKADVRLFLIAKKNGVALITNEGTLSFMCKEYHGPDYDYSLSRLLIGLMENSELTFEQVSQGYKRAKSKKQYLRTEDSEELKSYFDKNGSRLS